LKKSNAQNRNQQKNKQISIKTSSRTSYRNSLKNPVTPQKTSPNSQEKRKVGNTDAIVGRPNSSISLGEYLIL